MDISGSRCSEVCACPVLKITFFFEMKFGDLFKGL